MSTWFCFVSVLYLIDKYFAPTRSISTQTSFSVDACNCCRYKISYIITSTLNAHLGRDNMVFCCLNEEMLVIITFFLNIIIIMPQVSKKLIHFVTS